MRDEATVFADHAAWLHDIHARASCSLCVNESPVQRQRARRTQRRVASRPRGAAPPPQNVHALIEEACRNAPSCACSSCMRAPRACALQPAVCASVLRQCGGVASHTQHHNPSTVVRHHRRRGCASELAPRTSQTERRSGRRCHGRWMDTFCGVNMRSAALNSRRHGRSVFNNAAMGTHPVILLRHSPRSSSRARWSCAPHRH
jgi:hypothetical protein